MVTAEGDEYIIGPLKPYDEMMRLEDIVRHRPTAEPMLIIWKKIREA